jgi:hypothetical protein
MRQFLLAYRGLADWDDFHDPHYLNALLLPGKRPPRTARYGRTGA